MSKSPDLNAFVTSLADDIAAKVTRIVIAEIEAHIKLTDRLKAAPMPAVGQTPYIEPISIPKRDVRTEERREFLTPEEAAKFLGLKPQTLQNWRTTKAESIPYVKYGRHVRYRMDDLTDWLKTKLIR
jgi:excisionase family DNA binding protein